VTDDTDGTLQISYRGSQQILDEALRFCQASQKHWERGEFEDAIAALDHAYDLLLHAEPNGSIDLIQQKQNLRFIICRRMLEIYASRHTAINGNHEAIPMVMNRHVEREIELFRGPERAFFLGAYKRSGRYRPEILKALDQAGLPRELSWLPLVESGFKVNAFSRSRALGLWQFIPSTGYRFGLKRNRWIDERMDVQKSTQSAIAYLQELHRIFGDWCTALAAYNCGEARVLRVIRNQNVNYLDSFWDLFVKLPRETARFVPRFLATLFVVNQPGRFGFKLDELDPPIAYQTVVISKQLYLAEIAEALDVPCEVLKDLNPELRLKITPPEAYALKVPKGQAQLLVARLEEMQASTPPESSLTYHRVRRGETLSHLAQRYRISVGAIMEVNHIRRPESVRVGQRLRIPVRGSTQVSSKSKPLRHLVTKGDSLWLLAKRYNINIREIMYLNNLDGTRISVGQELIVSGAHALE
jgi:membrane-bound lytic murein transglycosylase D